MKFFIPAAEGEEQTKSIYESIIKFAEQSLCWKIKHEKIFSIKYKHNGQVYYAKVGEKENLTGDLVLAILKSQAYLICSISHGFLKGLPILVGPQDIINIEYFREN